ncbi:hypothetical protein [Pseudanabaena sp. UWO310]|uniref:hypothetical protein n=1 Tax=Pseudanabaena sp. UWO310 TaxID=2480795 RepID=UPI00115B1A3A|nr:hypothetical protein [Pseudanabaena sp. UWO310]TYQ28209.1 hypothetical protein PseudUWO310_14400 [Pseudanabaena sp. UWO310]
MNSSLAILDDYCLKSCKVRSPISQDELIECGDRHSLKLAGINAALKRIDWRLRHQSHLKNRNLVPLWLLTLD